MIALLTLLAIAQTSKAQYTLAIKDQLVPYDSAVIIELDKYRQETNVINLQSELIDSLRQETESLYKEIDKSSELNSVALSKISILVEQSIEKDKFIQDQSTTINNLYEESLKPTPIWNKTWFKIGIGAVAGIAITKF